jgi:response regulator RpfG family c-di-GMP phosphodiesterase
MIRPLIIHPDREILDRLHRESSSEALVTPSMIQALKWVMDPETRLSGVFLNPGDANFSAFQFLEIILTHRPALPVFLFEPQMMVHNETSQKIMKSAHIRGIFSGSEPYTTLIASLKPHLKTPETPRRVESVPDRKAGYTAIPIADFFTGTEYPHDVFVMDEKKNTSFFAQKNSKIDPVYLAKAAETREFLYVRTDDIQKNKEEVRHLRENYLESGISNPWKTAESLSKTKAVLTEMRSAGINDELIEYTKGMLGDLFRLISSIDSDEGAIHNMIEKAKQTDRSVFCASYSLLVAKHLRFEKNATLEILGLASVLQDISLYKTPFGDLTDRSIETLKKEEMSFYLQHPTLSADLVASHTDIPQVTLQVIRQHHERKDKTGFPNRIGGTQLHPMAEILSLINSYFEISLTEKNDALVIQRLQKEVFQHHSENMVAAFKAVLGNILKDKAEAAAKAQASN